MNRKRQKGFTLVEMILTMSLTAISVALVYQLISLAADLKELEMAASYAQREASEACFRFDREAREVRSSVDVLTADADDFQFVNTTGTTIRYWLSGSNLYRNSYVLAENISNLQFTYYDGNAAVIASPAVSPSQTEVRMVQMSLTVTDGGDPVSFLSQVTLRSL